VHELIVTDTRLAASVLSRIFAVRVRTFAIASPGPCRLLRTVEGVHMEVIE